MATGPLSAGGIESFAGSGNPTVLLLNCTISNNTVTGSDQTGNQLLSGQFSAGRNTIQLRNTIISGDGSRPNLFAYNGGTFLSQGHNLSSDDGSGFLTRDGDLTDTDPLLGPLQDNGGPTQTMALLDGSPAIDAGDNTDAPEWDQRGPGFPRIVGILDPDNPVIDVGAFEVQQDGDRGPGRPSGPGTKPLRLEAAAVVGMQPLEPVSQIASEAKPLPKAVDILFATDSTERPGVVVRALGVMDVASFSHKEIRQDMSEVDGVHLFGVFVAD
jgi:hypothetical protein